MEAAQETEAAQEAAAPVPWNMLTEDERTAATTLGLTETSWPDAKEVAAGAESMAAAESAVPGGTSGSSLSVDAKGLPPPELDWPELPGDAVDTKSTEGAFNSPAVPDSFSKLNHALDDLVTQLYGVLRESAAHKVRARK
jgi:hypothetical protein